MQTFIPVPIFSALRSGTKPCGHTLHKTTLEHGAHHDNTCPPTRATIAIPPTKRRPRAPTRAPTKRPYRVTQSIKAEKGSAHETSVAIYATPPPLAATLYELASSRGALGRGVRATLRAFHRRAAYVLAKPRSVAPVYVEIGPAYVLATARLALLTDHVTRYAVESRAWPALRSLLAWEETSSMEARARGAVLRRVFDGGRFGRHVFIEYDALAAVVHVAEELIGDMEDGPVSAAMELEATVEIKRRPLPGLRTVATRCPRGAQHNSGDRKPSLMLWMNPDGVTGGALCPVCVDYSTHESPPRNMTWRVHYMSDKLAALYTPRKRIRSPIHIQRAMAEYRRQEALTDGEDEASTETLEEDNSSTDKQATLSQTVQPRSKRSSSAVGGCVMKSKKRIGQVGSVIGMAYVTALLKMTRDVNTTGTVALEYQEGTRLRTVGTMAKQSCPMQVLLWSDRRSKGPTCSRRIEEVSTFARQSLACPDWDRSERLSGDEVVDSDEWLPTPLLSVSAMKPSGWRDVLGQNGRLVSLPASWEASAQAWILFDIDDIELPEREGVVAEAANKMMLVIRREKELSGRCLVMQTGPAGLHVWAELREVRETPGVWFKKNETRTWYSDVGTKLLHAAHRGGAASGKIDMSSCSAGRFARRPGWRLLEDGTSFRSSVIIFVPSAVRSRKPRLG